MPAVPAVPELPVTAALDTAEGVDGVEADDDAAPELPLLPAAKAGEAVELTCSVARSRVSCWSSGSATGSCDVSEAGSSVANVFAAESRVLRSMVILSPSSVRLAEGPLTLSVGLVTDREMPSSLSSVLMDEMGSGQRRALAGGRDPAAVDRHLLAGDVDVLHHGRTGDLARRPVRGRPSPSR